MRLVMFDVDGTLVKGNVIDEVCFSEAIKEVLGVDRIDTDWSHYLKVTDSGITSEIIEKHLARRAKESDILTVRESYLTRLRHEIEKDPQSFQATPGATELIADLFAMESVCISVATGGWQDSAILKLEVAGFSIENIPLASSDDSHERESIMIRSYERARVYFGCQAFQSVVYVGDHPWDYVNSKKLGYAFIGIGSGDQALTLRHAGAFHVLPDLVDKDYFFSLLGVEKIK